MINFTVGPVQSPDCVRKIAAEQVPYFRTAEFSELMFENERLIKQFFGAPEEARAVFLTGSGTASMEAAVLNAFDRNDHVLVINGGGFGQRFAEICAAIGIPYTELKLSFGEVLTAERLAQYDGCGLTGLLVNLHETSTGVLYDLNMISSFCRKNRLFLVVDAISSFMADEINMQSSGINIMLTGSQKALACDPGVSVIVMDACAVQRVQSHSVCSVYFDLKKALKDGERGQTPFTPAVNTLRQIHARLKEIEAAGGVSYQIGLTKALAEDFRRRIAGLPLEIASKSMSNAVTPLHPLNVSAYDVFLTLKDQYGIWICPNGGELADKVFRVGHIGNLTISDNDALIAAFTDMERRGLL